MFPNVQEAICKTYKSTRISSQEICMLETILDFFISDIFFCAQSVDIQVCKLIEIDTNAFWPFPKYLCTNTQELQNWHIKNVSFRDSLYFFFPLSVNSKVYKQIEIDTNVKGGAQMMRKTPKSGKTQCLRNSRISFVLFQLPQQLYTYPLPT